tara:strand:- start:136 stop:894 length:759 start_codon:yes stop_codon:yes gene_type:complete
MYIVIPSHARPKQLQNKTLALLKRHNIDMDIVFVFVSPESYDEYLPISNEYGFMLINSKANILDTRNHIIEYFDENQQIIEMDDDVEEILDFQLGEKGKPVENLFELFKESFKLFEKMDGGLWGFNANCNMFYIKDFKDKWGLYSIINSCLGYVNKKNVILTVPEKEDFERVLYFYKHKLPIVKRCRYGIKTKYWTNKGGIQDRYDKEKRTEIQNISADMILNNHSDCCYGRKRNNGIIDIRFRSSDPLRLC